jgi:MFS superfamily sulfate permease-like transporter
MEGYTAERFKRDVVVDAKTGDRHDSNKELIGQARNS